MSTVKTEILIIEDNFLNLELAKVLLEAHGFLVREATNALDGLEIIKTHQPRLVLMDVQLPGMDGLTATRLLRQEPAFANLLIIAVTAHAMLGDEAKAMEAGCNGYISKPINTRTFAMQIEEFLKTSNV